MLAAPSAFRAVFDRSFVLCAVWLAALSARAVSPPVTGPLQTDPSWTVAVEREATNISDIWPTAEGGFWAVGAFLQVDDVRTQGLVKFNADGSIDTDVSIAFEHFSNLACIAIQPDGKILLGGGFEISAESFTWNGLVRLNPDLSVDTAFKGGRSDVLAPVSVRKLAVAANGDIYVAGSLQVGLSRSYSVGRLNSAGEIDPSFSPSFASAGESGFIYDMVLLGDDRLVVAGRFDRVDGQRYPLVVALDFAGQVVEGQQLGLSDLSSGSTGWRLSRDSTGDVFAGVTGLQPAGGNQYHALAKFFADGTAPLFQPTLGVGVREIAADGAGGVWVGSDGSPTNSTIHHFDATLMATETTIIFPPTYPLVMSGLSDGGLVVTGSSSDSDGRLLSGLKVVDNVQEDRPEFDAVFRTFGEVNDLAVLSLDRVLLAGDFRWINGVERPYLAMIGADGELVSGFPAGGVTTNAHVEHVAVRDDEELYLSGAFSAYGEQQVAPVLRLNADGALDTDFVLNTGASIGGAQTMLTVAPDGGVFVGGWFWDLALGGGPGVVKVLPSGTQDPDFLLRTNGQFRHQAAVYVVSAVPDGGYYLGQFGEFKRVTAAGHVDTTYRADMDAISNTADIVLFDDHVVVTHSQGMDFLDAAGSSDPVRQVRDLSFNWGANAPLGRVYPDSDGGVLVAGNLRMGSGNNRIFRSLVRYRSDGSLDDSVKLVGGELLSPLAVGQLSDGNLVLASYGVVRRTGTYTPAAPEVVELSSAAFVDEGDDVTLTVAAVGAGELSYQWRKDGVDLSDATSATLVLGAVTAADAARYSVVVTNDLGSAVSAPVLVAVEPYVPAERALLASSAFITLARGATAYAPFRIQGSDTKTVLLRVVGPRLASFGFDDAMANPRLRLLDAAGAEIGINDDWGEETENLAAVASASTAVGALALEASSQDAALFASLPAGNYILEVSGSTAGTILIEVYDADALSSTTRLVHVGLGTHVSATDPVAMGLVLAGSGATTRDLILRAVASDLTVPGAIARARLTLSQGGTVFATNDRWLVGRDLSPDFAAVGAPLFDQLSYDAATKQDLLGGVFSVEFAAPDAQSGFGLLEVYDTAEISPPTAPFLILPAADESVVEGESIQLGLYAGGTEPLSYQWQRDGVDISGATSAVLTLTSAELSDAGSYQVVISNEAGELTTAGVAVSVVAAATRHSADTDADGFLSLPELLRVIELYNTRSGTQRTGRYQVAEGTADGFAPHTEVANDAPLSRFHSADFDRDGAVSLSELLRVIELYNTRNGTQRTGAYRAAEGTDDGFEPGPG